MTQQTPVKRANHYRRPQAVGCRHCGATLAVPSGKGHPVSGRCADCVRKGRQ